MSNPEDNKFDDIPILAALLGFIIGVLLVLVTEQMRGNI